MRSTQKSGSSDAMRKQGLFICIEGIDGSGKTTHAKMLTKKLREKGYDAVYTTEPSKGEIGSFIRKHILHGGKRHPTAIEALLFAADRIDHLEREIKPALAESKIVVCDRYLYSSLAYQGAAGLETDWIETINKHAVAPDFAILIDVPPEVVIKRINRKKSVMETLENLRRVRDAYMRFAEMNVFKVVNGNRPMENVNEDILLLATRFIEKASAKDQKNL